MVVVFLVGTRQQRVASPPEKKKKKSAEMDTTPADGAGWLPRLPFGGDVLFLSGEGPEAVVGEEGRAVLLDEAFDGLTPPAGVSVAAALQHQ